MSKAVTKNKKKSSTPKRTAVKSAKPRKSKNIALPDKPSELILLALEDLKQAIKDGCVVDMSSWHYTQSLQGQTIDADGLLVEEYTKSVCQVCLAGAVMRRGVEDNISCQPTFFPKKVEYKLLALDYFRVGNVLTGVERMGLPYSDDLNAIHNTTTICYYKNSPKRFRQDLTKLAKRLAKIGY